MENEEMVDSTNIISLSGRWDFISENNNSVILPGTTNTNQIGETFDFDGTLSKTNIRHLRQKNRYIGVACYQREICIPMDWDNSQIILYLERVMFSSKVYIDGKFVGYNDSLSVAHEYNISKYVSKGKNHILVIEIDNQDVNKIGTNPSAYTDETQTIWNGIVGKIHLIKKDMVHINKIKITSSVNKKEVALKLTIDNRFLKDVQVNIITRIREKHTGFEVAFHQEELELEDFDISYFEYIVKINSDLEIKLWDEFDPNLYEVEVILASNKICGETSKPFMECFGFRELRTKGNELKINDRPLFLRGTLDCCVFPLTGYPPCDENQWRKILTTVKEYGLNHVRYHSWCPPEACFKIADELGLYLQVEGPVWMDNWTNITVGSQKEHYEYLPKEAKRIIDVYGNHPSLCFFSNGNELNGDFTLLQHIIKTLKEEDKRFLYTLTSNWDRKRDELEDIFITQSVDGVGVRGQFFLDKMVEGTYLNYNKAVNLSEIPVISHEVGQYCVYPNIDEIQKYKGGLRPVNLEAIYNDLEKKDMIVDAKKFTKSSGKLALQLYKDEIEAALRTTNFGGIQLLDLHDFPGQSTATVGILDAFWESKGLITPEEFRGFCSETVCLLLMDKRIYLNKDGFVGKVQIAHYGSTEITQTVYWNMKDQDGSILYEGEFREASLSLGNLNYPGEIIIESFAEIKQAKQVTIKVWLEKRTEYNSWQIWIYPQELTDDSMNENSIIIRSTWDEETKRLLKQGENILLVPNTETVKDPYPGNFFLYFGVLYILQVKINVVSGVKTYIRFLQIFQQIFIQAINGRNC